jgi:prophage regulatory protein
MKFILRDGLKARGIAFSNKHLIQLEKAGRFPKRVRLGDQTVAWVEPEVDAYQQRLVEERDTPKAA